MNNLQLYSSNELATRNFLFYSPAGDFLVTGGKENEKVTIMKVEENQFYIQNPNPEDFVQKIDLKVQYDEIEHAFRPDAAPISASVSPTEISTICVGYEDGKVRLWNIDEQRILWTLDTNQHAQIHQFRSFENNNTNPHVSFFPDGKKILLGVTNNLLSVDISSGDPNQFTCKRLIQGYGSPVVGICFFPTKNIGLFCAGFQGLPKGEIFVMSEKDKYDEYRVPQFRLGLGLWSPIYSNSHLTVLAISPNSNYICAGDIKGNLYIYNLKLNSTNIVTAKPNPDEYHTDTIFSVAFTSDEKHICSCSEKSGLIFYESESGKRLFQIKKAHFLDNITHCAFSSNGRYLILGGKKINIYLNPFAYWDLKEHKQVIKHYGKKPTPDAEPTSDAEPIPDAEPDPSVPKNIMAFFLNLDSFTPRLPIIHSFDILEHLTYYGLFLHGNPEFV